MLKDELFRTGGLQFENWLFGPEKFSAQRGLFLESPEKPFVKVRPAYSVKLVFSYVVKGIKIKITAKFSVSRRLHFEDTKRIMSPEMVPKSFGTFEKRAPAFNFVACMTNFVAAGSHLKDRSLTHVSFYRQLQTSWVDMFRQFVWIVVFVILFCRFYKLFLSIVA